MYLAIILKQKAFWCSDYHN